MKITFKTPYQQEPERIGGVKIPYAKGKRAAARWRWYIIVLIVTSPLLFLLIKILLSYLIVTAPGYLSLEKVPINSNSTGIVSKILISAGTEVTDKQPLVQLYSPVLQEKDLILKTEIVGLEKDQLAKEDKKQTTVLPTWENYLEEQYQLALQRVKYQEKHLNDVQFLKKQGAATQAELREAEAAYQSALLALSPSKRDYFEYKARLRQLLQEPAAPVDIEYQQRLKLLQVKQDAIEDQIARLEQRAPYAGRILEIVAVEGQSVNPGSLLMVLGRMEKPSVQCYLDPKYAKYAKKGSQAKITFPDGSVEKVVVRQDARLVKRLPADLAAPIGTRDLLLLVFLEFQEQIPVEKRVDGLPVTVSFKGVNLKRDLENK